MGHPGYNKDSQSEPKWEVLSLIIINGEIYEVTKYTKDSILRDGIILSTKDVLLNHYRIITA